MPPRSRVVRDLVTCSDIVWWTAENWALLMLIPHIMSNAHCKVVISQKKNCCWQQTTILQYYIYSVYIYIYVCVVQVLYIMIIHKLSYISWTGNWNPVTKHWPTVGSSSRGKLLSGIRAFSIFIPEVPVHGLSMAMLMRKMKTKYAIYAILGSIFEKRSGVFFLYVITFFSKSTTVW